MNHISYLVSIVYYPIISIFKARILLSEFQPNLLTIDLANYLNLIPCLLIIILFGIIFYTYSLVKQQKLERIVNLKEISSLNSQLKGLIEGMDDCAVALDLSFRFLALNESFQKDFRRLFKESPQVGMFLEESLDETCPDKIKFIQLWQKSMATKSYTTEQLFESAKNGYRLYEIRSNGIYGENGEHLGAFHILRDITEIKQIPEQLSRIEDRFNFIVKATRDLVWDWDLISNTFWVNENIKTFGYSQGDLQNNVFWWYNHLHPDDSEAVMNEIQQKIEKGGTSWSMEYRFCRKDGSYSYVLDRGCILRNKDGLPLRLIGLIMDISERVRFEEELKNSEKQFRDFVENTKDWIWAVDKDCNLTYTNPAVQHILGYAPFELIGTRIINLMVEEDRKGLEKMLPNLIQQKSPLIGYTSRWVHKEGTIRWLESNAIPILNDQNQIIGCRGVDRDITFRKHIEMLKDEFVSMVSHELKTPLASIKGSLELLLKKSDHEQSPKVLQLLNVALNNCDRLMRLINDILDIEKIEANKMVFNLQPINLINLIEESLAVNNAYAAKFHVQLKFEKPKFEAVVLADKDRLMQVLTNLVSNAVKFSPQGQAVVVKIEDKNAMFKVSITDLGPGIPLEYQPKIFEKFSQARNTDRNKNGTGLGLSISKKIIEHLEGTIGFTSIPSSGSTFYFELPKYQQ